MIELVVFVGLGVLEMGSQMLGAGGFFLLLFAPILFLRERSLAVVLLGAGVSSLLSEAIHGYYVGSLMLGTGLALFLLHWTVEYIDWYQPVVQLIGLLVYTVLITTTRMILIASMADVVYWPLNGAWGITYAFGCVLVVLGTFRSRSAPSELNRL